MKMVKSLLLGSAAAFVVSLAASAADLPVRAKVVPCVKVLSVSVDTGVITSSPGSGEGITLGTETGGDKIASTPGGGTGGDKVAATPWPFLQGNKETGLIVAGKAQKKKIPPHGDGGTEFITANSPRINNSA